MKSSTKIEELDENMPENYVFEQNETEVDSDNETESVIKTLINHILDEVASSQNENACSNQLCEVLKQQPEEKSTFYNDICSNSNEINPEELSINLNTIQTQSSIIDEVLDTIISKETTENAKYLQPDSLLISQQNSQSQHQQQNKLGSNDSDQACESKIQVQFNEYQQKLDELEGQLSSFSDDQKTLGLIAPDWIPDSQTDECMLCSTKFTFTKRRHHCRTCGLIFCASCCNHRLQLPYNLKEFSRLCENCYETINTSKFRIIMSYTYLS
jgi:hypothetical protein